MRNSFNPVNYKTIKLIAAAEQRVVRQAFPVTISDLEPDKLGQPFRPAIFEIRDSNRPLSFFNIATIRLQHRQVRRHAVGF